MSSERFVPKLNAPTRPSCCTQTQFTHGCELEKKPLSFPENAAKNPKILAKIFSEIGAENAKVLETFAGKTLIGQKFQAETFAGAREFEVICDEVIDAEKGSGMMTISCHHSADDFDLLQRRAELKKYAFDKIGFDGKMLQIAGDCAGMEVEKARTKAAEINAAKKSFARCRRQIFPPNPQMLPFPMHHRTDGQPAVVCGRGKRV